MDNPSRLKTIRSYVLRQGRLTDAQARAIENHWHQYGIDFSKTTLDLDREFQRAAPKVLEIGSGMGETTLDLAGRYPENDYLAVEVHRPGAGSLIRNAVNLNIHNIRIICHDVVEVLQYQLPENCLDQVLILFPDPWPKKKHHKRRLVSPEFLGLLKPALKMNARLFLATDWEDLATHMLDICDRDPGLINLAGTGNFSPRPAWRRITKFETRGRKLNHKVWDLSYCPAP